MARPDGLRPAAALLALMLLPTACGSGLLYIGLGEADGDDGFDAASVGLAALHGSVAAGGRVGLAATAADPNGIDEVVFYRLDGRAAVRLGSDASAPFEWVAVEPDDGSTTLRLFARAIDGLGRRANSAVLELPVTH